MLKRAQLKRISRAESVKFMAQHELLGNIGMGVWHYGLSLGGELRSVVTLGVPCFSRNRGALSRIANAFNCSLVQLCRGGTTKDAPHGAPSRLIKLALRDLRKRRGSLVVVAYADPRLNEVGNIYQACNAVYTGMTDPKGQANYIIGGKQYSAWQVRKKYGTRDRNKLLDIDPDLRVVPLHPKHRYVLLEGTRAKRQQLRRALEKHSLPYPKRPTKQLSRTMASQCSS